MTSFISYAEDLDEVELVFFKRLNVFIYLLLILLLFLSGFLLASFLRGEHSDEEFEDLSKKLTFFYGIVIFMGGLS